jgi:hypothetical protein
MTIEERLDLRDRAVQAALNFVGQSISSADGSYDLLISVIQDAMDEWASVRVKAEREACLTIAVNTRENYHNLRRGWRPAAFIIENLIRSRTDRENAKIAHEIENGQREKSMAIEYNNSKPAIRKTGDDEYELIWNVSDQILCVSILTEHQIAELISSLANMMMLQPGAWKFKEIIYYFPTMNTRITG